MLTKTEKGEKVSMPVQHVGQENKILLEFYYTGLQALHQVHHGP